MDFLEDPVTGSMLGNSEGQTLVREGSSLNKHRRTILVKEICDWSISMKHVGVLNRYLEVKRSFDVKWNSRHILISTIKVIFLDNLVAG